MGRERRGKGVEVITHPSGKQSIRVRFSYKKVQCTETLKNVPVTKKNLEFAKNLVIRIKAEIGTGEFDYSKYFPQSKRGRRLSGGPSYSTLRDIMADYESDCIRRRLTPATIKTYMQPLNSWWLPRIGNLPMAEIDAAMIRQELRDMTQSPKTISVYKTAINRLLDYCVQENLIPANPALSVQVGRTVGRQKNAADNVDPFNKTDVHTILGAADDFMKAYLTMAFYTGLRPSELYALQWADVDLKQKRIFIRQAVVHGKLKPMPKTDAGIRYVDLAPAVVSVLKSQRANTFFKPHGCVWENPVTQKPLRRYKEIAGRWKRLLAKLEIRYRNPYQTRHTFASNLLSDGENLFYVSRQMGHKNTMITQKHYARWIREDYQRVSDYGDGADNS